MSAALEEKDRHIFPRWRSFESTAKLGELRFVQASIRNDLKTIDATLESEMKKLERSDSLWNSLDALGTAIVAGRTLEFNDLKNRAIADANTPPFAIAYLTKPSTSFEPAAAELIDAVDQDAKRRNIHKSRERIQINPSDAIEWVELARAYTIAGVDEKARRAIEVALSLAPENRFVLRSASRFYIHIGELDRAHHILNRSSRIKLDPWLLASEVAIADAIGKTSRNVKSAREHLSSGNPAPELTELASAMGTLESQGGNTRIARKFLRQSFAGANENSIAQINWLQRTHLGEEIDTSNATPPLLHEANAWLNYHKADWEATKRESLLWLLDQPFASAPALLSSYILSDILGEFEVAENILEAAILSNPDEAMLLNNLAFSQLNLNKVDEAERILQMIKPEILQQPGTRLIQATFGMLAFRKGNPESGRELYRQCIDTAVEQGDRRSGARAAAHLLLEEIVANTDHIEAALQRLRGFEAEATGPEIVCVLGRAQSYLSEPIIAPSTK